MKGKSVKLVVLGIVLVLLASGIGTVSAFSNAGGGDWKYYKAITVKENSGKTLTNYQVLVELNPSNFPANAKSDGSDLRFEDESGKELSSWIEEWNSGVKKAKIWVKVPSIPANGETKIKMYYGNPSAGAVSDGDKVFEFFDDFEDGDFTNNPTWSKVRGSDASITTIDGDHWIKLFRIGNLDIPAYKTSGTFDLSQSFVITYKLRLSSGDQTGGGLALGTNDGYVLYNIGLNTGHWNAAETGPNSWSSGFGYNTAKTQTFATYCVEIFENYFYFASDNTGLSRDITHDIKLIYTSSNHNWKLFVDDEDKGSIKGSTNYDRDISKIHISGKSATGPGNGAYFDDILVRKYTPPEPTLTLSAEYPKEKMAQMQTVWQIGKFDTSGSEFGGLDFPSMVDYIIPADWATRTAWKDFPSGQEAWKTDDNHPYNSNGVNIHFEALAGEYILTIGQQKTSHSETVPVLLDGRHIESFVTSTAANKNHVIKFKIDSSGRRSLTLDRFTSGYGYIFDAVKLEVVEYAPTPTSTPTAKSTPTPPTPPPGKIKAVWLYNHDKYDTVTLMTDLKSAGINTIFLSTDVNNIWKYERFVKSAHENGIEVHAMILEDPRCALKENHASSIKAVETVLDYNEKSLAKFNGINIDTEPYVDLDLEQVWQDYITLLEAIHEKTEGKTVLSADIPRWYDGAKIKDLAPNVDFFVIMAYDSGGAGWNTASEIEDAVASEMGAIRGEGSDAVIGIGVHEGFEDKEAVEKCVDELYKYYFGDSAFSGEYQQAKRRGYQDLKR
ncbi:MAG: DUF2341 domain-containing protein [Methanomicrobia archaeon]|nr:DUF2341 domain-containing protein [Methanomicrobia archaeon]